MHEAKNRMGISTTSDHRARIRERAAAPLAHREIAAHASVAPFMLRCGAVFIDYILVAAVLAVATILSRTAAGIGARTDSVVEGFGYLAAAGLLIFNFIIFAGLTNRTLGKWAMGLRIERMNGSAASFARVALRHIVGYPLSLVTLGTGFLIAVFNRDGRALHDFMFDTIVVRNEATTRRPPSPLRQTRMPDTVKRQSFN